MAKSYGSSFIAVPTGEIVIQADRENKTVLVVEFDLDEVREKNKAGVHLEIEDMKCMELL